MNILALDTSTGTSVAVVHDGHALAEFAEADTRGHAEAVGRLIDQALRAAQLSRTDIDLVVVGVGPGPFTGLRVGIAAGIGFAVGIGRPVVGVPSHAGIALAAGDVPVTVATDARRREVFVTDFTGLDADGLPQPVASARTEPATWPAEQGIAVSAHVPAAALATIAWRRHERELSQQSTEPIYVRQPDVGRAKPKYVLG